MKCLITGASSGIGKSMAIYMSEMGYEIIMVSNNKEKLEKASKKVKNSTIYVCDLRDGKDVDKFCQFILDIKPDIVINNAGFGAFGFYDEIDVNREIDMINVNVISLHKITRTCLKYMDGDKNYILNVSSSAGFMPAGPLLNTYYATKNYVRSYTLGIYKELKERKSKVNVSVLCPGPVDTNFNNVAGGHFSVKSLSSEYVAKYAIDKMFKKKLVIVPGFMMKLGLFMTRFVPIKLMLVIAFRIQHKKRI